MAFLQLSFGKNLFQGNLKLWNCNNDDTLARYS